MNQIGVGLIIGGVVGFGIGLTLAPDVALPGISSEQQDLLCLEERTQLMDEVREALKKMELAHRAPEGKPALEEVPAIPVIPAVSGVSDAGSGSRTVSVATGPVRKPAIKPLLATLVKPSKPVAPVADTGVRKSLIKAPVRPKKKPPVTAAEGDWMVQLIATADPAEAGKLERRAHGLGLKTRIVLEEVPDQSHSLYKVRIGPFSDKSGGVEALRRIRRELKITGWLHRGN